MTPAQYSSASASCRTAVSKPLVNSGQGFDVIASGPEAFAAYLKAELAKWAAVVKAADLKPE
jgi:tripartite-type tricarboxylate transporter receptor subunit TctC